MAVQNNRKVKVSTNQVSNSKKNNTVSKTMGKIDTKKVFPKKKDSVEVEEISVEEALSTRVKRYQKFYDNSTNKNIEEKKGDNNLSITKQQKFNFENTSIEDEMDTSFTDENKKKKVSNKKENVSVKIEEIPIKREYIQKHEDYFTITTLFLTVVIVFMGVFLIYHFGTFDHDKVKVVTKVKKVAVVPENIVFLGDSITNFYDLDKFYKNKNVVNSGVNGNMTTDILDDLKTRVYRYNPSHVILLIGTNDLADGRGKEEIVDNIKKIIKEIKKNVPNAKIYLESIYPINDSDDDKINHNTVDERKNDDIKDINKDLKKYANDAKIKYIDLYDKLADDDGKLKIDYTKDGLHLSDKGYDEVTFYIKKILKDE